MKTVFEIDNEIMTVASSVYTTCITGTPGNEVFKIFISKSRHVGSMPEPLVFTNREDFAKALMEISFGEHRGACRKGQPERPKLEASFSYDLEDVQEWLNETPKQTNKKKAKKK